MNQPKGGVQTKPSSQDLRNGLLRALNGADDIVAFPNKLLYQFEDAKPYNLDYPIRPAAVTYPKTPEQISDIVKYAASADLKVQVRSGGHSYANYCMRCSKPSSRDPADCHRYRGSRWRCGHRYETFPAVSHGRVHLDCHNRSWDAPR